MKPTRHHRRARASGRLAHAALSAALLAPLAHAQQPAPCQPPATDPNDTQVGAAIEYRARFERGPVVNNQLGNPDVTLDVPSHATRFDVGFDRSGRLITRSTVTSPSADGSNLGGYGAIRSLHMQDNQLVTHDNGCQYLGSSPDNRSSANPIGTLPTNGSVTQGLLVQSLADLERQGTVTRPGGGLVRVATAITPSVLNGNVAGEIVRLYREAATALTLERAEITTFSLITVNGRTEYLKNTSTHDFTGVAGNINAAKEALRAHAVPNGSPPQRGTVGPAQIEAAAKAAAQALAAAKGFLAPKAGTEATAGVGPQNVVFQHGIFSDGGTWERMDGWLAGDYLFGTKMRPNLKSTDPILAQRDQLIALMGQSGVRDYLLIGHSNGGLVSRAAAQARPDLVRGVITNSTLHNGAILAQALRDEAARGVRAAAGHLGNGCATPFDDVGCFLAAVLGTDLVSGALTNTAFDLAIPVTRDMRPSSELIAQLNATPEAFPRFSIENLADPRWVAFRVVGDSICYPESGCGGRAWVKYVNASYIAFRTCVPVALTLSVLDFANFQFYRDLAALCSHISGAMDYVDNYWNDLYSKKTGGDGIVQIDGMRWNGARAVRIASADSHQGVNRSDKVRTELARLLDEQFQVPRRTAQAVAVSGASYANDGVAPASIVSIFGTELAQSVAQATSLPLPRTLGGSTVEIRDAAGVSREAELFFVSPGQINALVPAETALGQATLFVRNAAGVVRTGVLRIAAVTPGLFTADSGGRGPAGASAPRGRAAGSTVNEPVASWDAALGRMVLTPIEVARPGEHVYLVLFGTGIRNRSALEGVTLQVGGLGQRVEYAGAQGMAGLDQINVLLDPALAGRGETDVVLSVDGRGANAVKVGIR